MQMNENQQKVIGQILMQFSTDDTVTEDQILKYVNAFSVINPLTDVEKEEVTRELQSTLKVRIDRGACVREKNHTPWYHSAKADIKPS